MTLQSSGKITFSNIEAEFGDGGSNRNIGKYRVSYDVGGMTNLPLDDGIPQSGQIAFSDFYGKQLNIIVSYKSNQNRPSSGKSKYNDNNDVTVIGGFKSKPSSSSGCRITLHVHPDKTIGSSKDSRRHCALRTGSGWESGTELEINIGENAVISGAGGNGGKGGKSDGETDDDDAARGFDGSDGSSAIGIQYEVDKIVIRGGAVVRAGCGGGGGGGGAGGELDDSDERVGGGGGGGGQGIPAGEAGEAGTDDETELDPEDGENGSSNSGGDGGNGGINNEGNSGESAQGGGGGGGGGFGGSSEVGVGGDGYDGASNGENGSTNGDGGDGGDADAEGTGQQTGPGGSGGEVGYAIVREENSYISNSEITGNGTVQGSISTGEVN